MGTPSMTQIIHEGRPLVSLKVQYDGFPDAHGVLLQQFLQGTYAVKSASMADIKSGAFHGEGDLAARLVRHLATARIVHPESCDYAWLYRLWLSDTDAEGVAQVMMEVSGIDVTWTGRGADFSPVQK